MAQTDLNTYGFELDVAQAGQLADMGLDRRVDSFAAEADVAFGQAVKRGTDPEKQCEPIGADADDFLGVALFTHTREQGFDRAATPASTGSKYLVSDTVSVLRKGRVYVNAAGEVNPDDDAYVDPATAEFTASSTETVGPVGKFQGSLADGGLVAVDIFRE